MLSGYVPALLRGSLLWFVRRKRLVLSLEMFELQGYNVMDDDPAKRSPLAEGIKKVPATAQRSMAGNAMHLQCVGAALIFLLACTHKREIA